MSVQMEKVSLIEMPKQWEAMTDFDAELLKGLLGKPMNSIRKELAELRRELDWNDFNSSPKVLEIREILEKYDEYAKALKTYEIISLGSERANKLAIGQLFKMIEDGEIVYYRIGGTRLFGNQREEIDGLVVIWVSYFTEKAVSLREQLRSPLNQPDMTGLIHRTA